MSISTPKDLAASVRQRLLNLAKEKGEEYNIILVRYALERFLYRISRSDWKDRFLLKGAMLFPIWFNISYRSTRDMDLLAFGDGSVSRILDVFKVLCDVMVDDDGMKYLKDSITGSEIREDNEYLGVRIQILSMLGNAHIPLQIDVAFGDIITTPLEDILYPTLLEFPAPSIRVYTKYAVVAEKFQATVVLGIANSRMKDFYDLWIIANHSNLDGPLLSNAIHATFNRRKTSIPTETPLSLTDSFSEDPVKKTQWVAFARKKVFLEKEELNTVIQFLQTFLMPPTIAAAKGEPFPWDWPAGGPWKKRRTEKEKMKNKR